MEKLFKESIFAKILDAIPEYAQKYLRVFYLVILCMYVGSFQTNSIIWTDASFPIEFTIWGHFNNTMLWFCVLYIGVVLVMWRQKWYTVLLSLALIIYVILYGRDMYYDNLRKVVAVFLAIAAYKIDYIKVPVKYCFMLFSILLYRSYVRLLEHVLTE